MTAPVLPDFRAQLWLNANQLLENAQAIRKKKDFDVRNAPEYDEQLRLAQVFATMAALPDSATFAVMSELQQRSQAEAGVQEKLRNLINEKLKNREDDKEAED